MLDVHTTDGVIHEVDKANTWHVDEFAALHLKDSNRKPVATFAPGQWIGVKRVTR